jgi:hypothetical protein
MSTPLPSDPTKSASGQYFARVHEDRRDTAPRLTNCLAPSSKSRKKNKKKKATANKNEEEESAPAVNGTSGAAEVEAEEDEEEQTEQPAVQNGFGGFRELC